MNVVGFIFKLVVATALSLVALIAAATAYNSVAANIEWIVQVVHFAILIFAVAVWWGTFKLLSWLGLKLSHRRQDT